jgi:peptide/nickel transport system permease protein
MWRYLAKRVLLLLVVVWGITLLTFTMISLAPGDPAMLIAEARYGTDLTPEQIEMVRAEEGFDSSVVTRYSIWMGHLLQGDLGNSLVTGDPVWQEIVERLPATLMLAGFTMILVLSVVIPLGIVSATRPDGRWGRIVELLAMTGISIPNFWLGLMLILLFSVTLGILPSFGMSQPTSIILPAITLAVPMTCMDLRLMRSSMREVMGQEFIYTARMKGLDERTVVMRHALKNSLLPLLTFAGLQLGFLLGGAVIVETIFSWPGIGKLMVDSIMVKDFALIAGCVLLVGVLYAIANLLTDLAYAVIDPRVRYDL